MRKRRNGVPQEKLATAEQDVGKLRREIASLREENDILKKAAISYQRRLRQLLRWDEGAAVGHAAKLSNVVEAAGDTLREESHLKSEVVFVSNSQLKQWAEALPVQRRPVRLRLDLPALADTERAGWQQQLERLHNDCGCSAAAVASLASLLLIAGYAILVGFDQPLWLIAIASMLGAVAALFAGKWFGHFRSRTKLQSDVGHLTQLIEHRAADEPRT